MKSEVLLSFLVFPAENLRPAGHCAVGLCAGSAGCGRSALEMLIGGFERCAASTT